MARFGKITCEAYTRKSIKEGNPVRCKAKGMFIPNSQRFLCGFHNGHRSWSYLTQDYKGLYRNKNLPLTNKIKVLKNLKNFANKSDEEIKQYIKRKQELATDKNFRSEFYHRRYKAWRNSKQLGNGNNRSRDSRKFTNILTTVISDFKSRSKI